MDYAKALFDIAMIISGQSVMLVQVAFGYYRLRHAVPEGVTVREDLPKEPRCLSSFPRAARPTMKRRYDGVRREAANWPSRWRSL